MSKRPSDDDLRIAAEWLENYEGRTDDENAPFLRVAEWLKQQVADRELRAIVRKTNAEIKAAGGTHGFSVKDLRERLARMKAEKAAD
jgi:hypothetical protein